MCMQAYNMRMHIELVHDHNATTCLDIAARSIGASQSASRKSSSGNGGAAGGGASTFQSVKLSLVTSKQAQSLFEVIISSCPHGQ